MFLTRPHNPAAYGSGKRSAEVIRLLASSRRIAHQAERARGPQESRRPMSTVDRMLATHRLRLLAILLALACSNGCNRLWDWSLGGGKSLESTLSGLSRTDRMTIRDRARDRDVVDTRDSGQIEVVVGFFRRYPDHWVTFSGAGGDYDIFLYSGGDLVGRLGLTASSRVQPGEDTLNVGDYFRRVPQSEVAALARRVDLVWPPPDIRR